MSRIRKPKETRGLEEEEEWGGEGMTRGRGVKAEGEGDEGKMSGGAATRGEGGKHKRWSSRGRGEGGKMKGQIFLTKGWEGEEAVGRSMKKKGKEGRRSGEATANVRKRKREK